MDGGRLKIRTRSLAYVILVAHACNNRSLFLFFFQYFLKQNHTPISPTYIRYSGSAAGSMHGSLKKLVLVNFHGCTGFHLGKMSKGGGATGGIWTLGLGMMVKDVTKFHKCHLRGRGMLMCVCVQDFIQDFKFWEGGGLFYST